MIKWIKSKSGQSVPVLNGLNLCSTVNPVQEAKKWADSNRELIQDFEYIFVLGIAGGFHIEAIQKINPKAIITIIEKEQELAKKFEYSFNHLVSILINPTAEDIKRYEAFHSIFEQCSYCVLAHEASVGHDRKYYNTLREFIIGRSQEGIQYISSLKSRKNPYFKKIIEEFEISGNESIIDITEKIKKRQISLEDEDLIWMSLRELVH